MFWVLKRTVSLRQFFWVPTNMFWLRNKEINFRFALLTKVLTDTLYMQTAWAQVLSALVWIQTVWLSFWYCSWRIYLKKIILKISADDKKHEKFGEKLPSMQRVKWCVFVWSYMCLMGIHWSGDFWIEESQSSKRSGTFGYSCPWYFFCFLNLTFYPVRNYMYLYVHSTVCLFEFVV